MASYLAKTVLSHADSRGREVPIPQARALIARPRRNRAPHPGAPLLHRIEPIEEMLDETWPGWREYAPFTDVHPDHARRVKWLLKRRVLLLQGRDWGVLLVNTVKQQSKAHAHPVSPPEDRRELEAYYARYELWNPPEYSVSASPSLGHGVIVATLAKKFKADPARVKDALSSMPAGFTPDLWVRRHLKDHQ